jgi:P-type E1-E2 ATPase
MTTVAVVRGGAVLGVIGLADAPREEASAAVRRLESLGVASAMLTGDNPATARSVAAQVGIREVYAGLLPEEKVEQVQVLRRRGLVAMVGDGVNDAPALAEGDVGIAMGVAGSDVALETADVALMSDNLEKVPRAIELARATRRVSMENVAASVAILAVLIPLAALGVIGISLAVVAHEGSEILVVASAIRMLRS